MDSPLEISGKKRHSPLGLLSCGLWLLVVCVDFWVWRTLFKREGFGGGGLSAVLIFYFPILIAPLVHVIGLTLSIVGMAQASRKGFKKVFCILGLLLHTVVALAIWLVGVLIVTPVGVH